MVEIHEEFKAAMDLAILAGACETKARYFANKEIKSRYGLNVFDLLGMTKKSQPNSDEILYAVTHSKEPVAVGDILLNYPFTRLTTGEVVAMLDNFEEKGLVVFDGTYYTGV